MPLQSYKFSRGLCLNNFLQVLLIVNQRDQVPLFRYINWADQVSHFFRGRKVLVDMKYLMRSVKRAAQAIGIWIEENWDQKRVNSLYTMLSGEFNFKINSRFDSLSCSLVVRYLYTNRFYIIGSLNEEQEQAFQERNKKRQTPFFSSGFQFYYVTKGLLTRLNEQV